MDCCPRNSSTPGRPSLIEAPETPLCATERRSWYRTSTASGNRSLSPSAMVLFNSYRAHQSTEFHQVLRENGIYYTFVPAACTDRLQPLDQTVNHEFKEELKMPRSTPWPTSTYVRLPWSHSTPSGWLKPTLMWRRRPSWASRGSGRQDCASMHYSARQRILQYMCWSWLHHFHYTMRTTVSLRWRFLKYHALQYSFHFSTYTLFLKYYCLILTYLFINLGKAVADTTFKPLLLFTLNLLNW